MGSRSYRAQSRKQSVGMHAPCAFSSLKAASHRIRLRLTIRPMANSSLHTSSIGRIRVNFLGFDRLPAYLKLFSVAGLPVLSVMVFLLHVGRPGLRSRKSRHPTPTPGNFDYPTQTPTPTPTPDRLRPSAVLVS